MIEPGELHFDPSPKTVLTAEYFARLELETSGLPVLTDAELNLFFQCLLRYDTVLGIFVPSHHGADDKSRSEDTLLLARLESKVKNISFSNALDKIMNAARITDLATEYFMETGTSQNPGEWDEAEFDWDHDVVVEFISALSRKQKISIATFIYFYECDSIYFESSAKLPKDFDFKTLYELYYLWALSYT